MEALLSGKNESTGGFNKAEAYVECQHPSVGVQIAAGYSFSFIKTVSCIWYISKLRYKRIYTLNNGDDTDLC